MDEVLALYSGTPLATRAFLRGRVLLSDLEAIERYVPAKGTIVDLGCGHGLLSNLMAMRSAATRLIGVAPSTDTITLPRTTVRNSPKLHFYHRGTAEVNA